jgi:hypothetical protein
MTLNRSKSTGYRSENSHLFGHARDILGQLQIPKGQLLQVVYAILTIDAGGLDDWPRGGGEPKPWGKATGLDAALAITRAHWFADYYGLWLTEYEGKRAMRVYYGGNT